MSSSCFSHVSQLQALFITAGHCLNAEIKGSLQILQTANDGRKGQVSHSPKSKTANLWCVLFTSSQRAFRFHRGIYRLRHKTSLNIQKNLIRQHYAGTMSSLKNVSISIVK